MTWKIFDSLRAALHLGGKNQKQTIKGSQNVVASQSKGAPATSVIQAQVVVERHGVVRTPTQLFGDFDHAIDNYHKAGEENPIDPPALLVTDWDIMIINMLFRDKSALVDKLKIVDDQITYKGIPLVHPGAGVIRYTPPPKESQTSD